MLKFFSTIQSYSYTSDEMYDVVVDVAKYREFVPWCIRSDVIHKLDHSNIFKAHMEIGFQVLKEQYIAVVTHQKPTLVKVGYQNVLLTLNVSFCSVCLYRWTSISPFNYGMAIFTRNQ